MSIRQLIRKVIPFVNYEEDYVVSELIYAASDNRLDDAESLIEEGADLNARDNYYGRTPLFKSNSIDMAQLLIEKGADIDAKDDDGNTPLHIRSQSNSNVTSEFESCFKARRDKWECLYPGNLLRVLEAAGHDIDTRKKLLTHAQMSELRVAALLIQKGIAELLVDKGADIEAKNNGGYTPLDSAVGSNSIDMTRLLIEKGADINTRSNAGSTPLHDVPSCDIAQLLIENGADIDAKDKDGWTPLHHCAQRIAYAPGSGVWQDLAMLFIENGAKIDEKDEKGRTPLKVGAGFKKSAPQWVDFAKLLIDKGADTSGIKLKFDL